MKRIMMLLALPVVLSVVSLGAETARGAERPDPKKLVMVAGKPSHPPGAHEFNAGVLLLEKCLRNTPQLKTSVYLNGWPSDPTVLDDADAILLFMDGYAAHELILGDRLQQIEKLMRKGVGLVCVHYAVEVPKEKAGAEMLDWLGGFYERDFSVNPHWTAQIKQLPDHPITRGVKPDTITDEWYFNMRFRPEKSGVMTILSATPPDEVRRNDATRQFPGREETLAWAYERADGGRGFGCTGGHFHHNWGNDNFRKLVLNALLWAAKVEVPADGVQSVVTADELKQNLDPKPPPTKRPAARPKIN